MKDGTKSTMDDLQSSDGIAVNDDHFDHNIDHDDDNHEEQLDDNDDMDDKSLPSVL
jgi:hypothetical protein